MQLLPGKYWNKELCCGNLQEEIQVQKVLCWSNVNSCLPQGKWCILPAKNSESVKRCEGRHSMEINACDQSKEKDKFAEASQNVSLNKAAQEQSTQKLRQRNMQLSHLVFCRPSSTMRVDLHFFTASPEIQWICESIVHVWSTVHWFAGTVNLYLVEFATRHCLWKHVVLSDVIEVWLGVGGFQLSAASNWLSRTFPKRNNSQANGSNWKLQRCAIRKFLLTFPLQSETFLCKVCLKMQRFLLFWTVQLALEKCNSFIFGVFGSYHGARSNRSWT